MAAGKAVLRSAVVAAEERLLARKAASELAGLATRELKGAELKAIRGAAAIGRPPLLSAEELNKPVQQIGAGMGPKRMLTPDERSGVMRILNVLDRIRANPEDLSVLSRDLGDRALKKMRYGNYAKEGWYESTCWRAIREPSTRCV
jgi:hypothetical protein